MHRSIVESRTRIYMHHNQIKKAKKNKQIEKLSKAEMAFFRNYLVANLVRKPNVRFETPFSSKSIVAGHLKVSESCSKRLKEICDEKSFLRVSIEGGGCSGFQYKFDIDDKYESNDLVFGEKDARVVIDQTSIEYIDGSTIDFHTELIRSGFRVIKNPKAEQGCSCGASFSIRLD